MLSIVRVERLRQTVREVSIYDFKQTDHLDIDGDGLTGLKGTQFELYRGRRPNSWGILKAALTITIVLCLDLGVNDNVIDDRFKLCQYQRHLIIIIKWERESGV